MSEKSFYAVASVNRSSVRILIGGDILHVFVLFCKRSYPLIFKDLRFSPITAHAGFADTEGVEIGYSAYIENDVPEDAPEVERKTAIATILPLVEERID